MASSSPSLEAENARLVSEMASMKKKIMHALKKQQSELQARIQAAEQRASAAEAAMQCISSSARSQSEEVSSSERSGTTLREEQQGEAELARLRAQLEDERVKLESAKDQLQRELQEVKVEHQRKMEQLTEAKEGLEAQLQAAAQQVSQAFSQISELQSKLTSLTKEKDSVEITCTNLSEEHDKISKELDQARSYLSVKEQEMDAMMASHRSTQEGQEAAISQLMQQLQTVQGQPQDDEEASRVRNSEKQCEALRQELSAIQERDAQVREQNDNLRMEVAKLKAVNETLTSAAATDGPMADMAPLIDELTLCKGRILDLERDLAVATGKASALSMENEILTKKLDSELKERDEKYSDLDLKFNRLQKRAKQRIQEVQKEKEDLEGQLKQAMEKQSSVQNDLERFRSQAGDAIRALDAERQNLRNANSRLKEEIDDVKRSLDSKEHNLAESRRLASDKDQALLAMQAEMKQTEEMHAAAVTELGEIHKKVMEGLQGQLNESALDNQKLAETVKALQMQLTEKESKLADAEAALTGEVARLSAAAEAAKIEAARFQEEQENERKKWHSSVSTLTAKIKELEASCQQMRVASAESKSRWEFEKEKLQKAIDIAQREASSAKDEANRISNDFAAYKARAHALLQKKDFELQAAKDVDLAAEQEARLKDAQKEAVAAIAERDRAVNSLKHAVAEYETQLAARNVAVLDAEQRIKELATKLESAKGLLANEREEWESHSKELDASWRQKYEDALNKQPQPAEGKIKEELFALRQDYERLKGDFDSYREMANKMLEAKDLEIAKLLDDNDKLHKSQTQEELKTVIEPINTKAVPDDGDSMVAIAEQQILLLARQQARREEELKQCQRQIDVLQEVITELEHENRLHIQQETVLKEELRNVDRATKRNGVDLTYLKNVILKLLETGEVEALLPVLGTLLQFSPSELKRCQEAYANAFAAEAMASTPKSLLSRLSFGSK